MKDLIRFTDLQLGEIDQIFHLADDINDGKYNDFLKGKSIVLFFPDTSIRTRVTFEKGIYLLGVQGKRYYMYGFYSFRIVTGFQRLSGDQRSNGAWQ